jgi:hypothetical protein
MKKFFILLSILFVSSCVNETSLPIKESSIPTQHSDSHINKMESLLVKSEGLEESIKNVVQTKQTLLEENENLKVEIKEKDETINKLNFQIKEYTVKKPGKKNFFEKVLNIQVDSITVIEKDTIN